MYDRLLTFLWYSLLLTLSSCQIHQMLFKFELTWDIMTMYRYSFLLQLKFISTGIIFSHGIFCSKWISFHRQYLLQDISWFRRIQRHFQDLENEFVVFQDVWEICCVKSESQHNIQWLKSMECDDYIDLIINTRLYHWSWLAVPSYISKRQAQEKLRIG